MTGTFVSVGNGRQPFGRLLAAVSEIEALLPHPIVVQHGHTPFQHPRFELRPFMAMDEFTGALGRSRVVVLHAGAGSILQALEHGRMPVVMARRADLGEIVDDHQLELAAAFAELGLAQHVRTAEELARAVSDALLVPAKAQLVPNLGLIDAVSRSLADHADRCVTRRGRL